MKATARLPTRFVTKRRSGWACIGNPKLGTLWQGKLVHQRRQQHEAMRRSGRKATYGTCATKSSISSSAGLQPHNGERGVQGTALTSIRYAPAPLSFGSSLEPGFTRARDSKTLSTAQPQPMRLKHLANASSDTPIPTIASLCNKRHTAWELKFATWTHKIPSRH